MLRACSVKLFFTSIQSALTDLSEFNGPVRKAIEQYLRLEKFGVTVLPSYLFVGIQYILHAIHVASQCNH